MACVVCEARAEQTGGTNEASSHQPGESWSQCRTGVVIARAELLVGYWITGRVYKPRCLARAINVGSYQGRTTRRAVPDHIVR